MATTVLQKSVPTGPRRKTWTRLEVAALAESGVLDVERLELVEGELFDKMGKNRPHINTQHRIIKILIGVFGIDRVTQESAIDVHESDRPSSEPEPDVVVTGRDSESFQSPPQPADVLLLVEISDTTLRFDLRNKAALYARAGIAEYWMADLNGRTLIVHREPRLGAYDSVVSYDDSKFLTPLAAPGHSIAVGSLFP
jgi:Uma2 family endonuclease